MHILLGIFCLALKGQVEHKSLSNTLITDTGMVLMLRSKKSAVFTAYFLALNELVSLVC